MVDAIEVALDQAKAGLDATSLFWTLKNDRHPDLTREAFGSAVTYALVTGRIHLGENCRYYLFKPKRILRLAQCEPPGENPG